MIFDSGELFSTVSDEIANELKLTAQQTIPYLGTGTEEHAHVGITKGHELRLGALVPKDMTVFVNLIWPLLIFSFGPTFW